MNKYHLIFALLFIPGMSTQAQNENSSFFKESGLKAVGLELQLGIQTGRIDQSDAIVAMSRAGLVLNEKWSAGLFAHWSINHIRPKQMSFDNNEYLDVRMAGAYAHYRPWSGRKVHLSFPLLIGGGEVELDHESLETNSGEAYFIQLEPGIMCEFNLWPKLAVHTSMSYRLTSDISYMNLPAQSLSGLQLQLGARWIVKKSY